MTSFAGYSLKELETLCVERANKRDDPEVQITYSRVAQAALPFLIARLRRLEPYGADER